MTKKIKSIAVYKYDHQEGIPINEQDDKGYKYGFTEMNDQGNIILDEKYNATGGIEDKSVHNYNDKGHLIEEFIFMQDDEIADHRTYEPDENGNIIRELKHYADGTTDTIEYKLDEQGQILEKTTTDSDNEIEAKEIYTYQNNKLTGKEEYEYGKLVAKESISYDNSGMSIENSKWQMDGEVRRNKYVWDENGRLEKVLTYNEKDKLISKSLYSYNDRNMVTEIDEENLRGRTITTMMYDEQGNVIEQTESNGQGGINNTVSRKFNDRNDVIATKVFIDLHGTGINQEYTLRYEYEYFE
jgi:YD repeat-containing protein